jgi:nitrogen regulatory protein PII
MNKSDLKKVIKPLVKECIHEVLLEEGLLSNIVSEVVKGVGPQTIVEAETPPTRRQKKTKKSNIAIQEHRRKMMDAVNRDAYNGVDLFEGTEPLSSAAAGESKAGSVDLGDPRDPGVDISSILGDSSQIWQAIK